MSQMSGALSPKILEILASRLCHDLISPVGAIGNGVELLEEFGLEAGADATDLIAGSAKKANVHLRAFRWGYGSSGADSDVKPADIKNLFQEYIALTKAEFVWEDASVLQSVLPPRGMLKGLLNTLILAAEGLGRGGKITFRVDQDEPLVFCVVCEAEKFTFREQILEAFKGELEEDELTPRNIHGFVTRLLCEYYGMKVRCDMKSETEILFFIEEG